MKQMQICGNNVCCAEMLKTEEQGRTNVLPSARTRRFTKIHTKDLNIPLWMLGRHSRQLNADWSSREWA